MDFSGCDTIDKKMVFVPEDTSTSFQPEEKENGKRFCESIIGESDSQFDGTGEPLEPSNNDSPIDVIRCRYFFEFVSPFKINCIDEWTLFHNSSVDDEIEAIDLDSSEFKLNLQILDSDQTLLEFHASESKYFGDTEGDIPDPIPGQSQVHFDSETQSYPIVIDFPHGRPIRPGEYRTIRLTYAREVPYYSSKTVGGKITIPLDNSLRTYITLRQTETYCFQNIFLIQAQDGSAFEIQYLAERDQIQILDNYQQDSITILVKTPIPDCNLDISFSYEVHSDQKRWFDLGVILGISTAILYPFIYVHDAFFSPVGGIPILLAVITYLTVTKGWLFMKDVDKVSDIGSTRIGGAINYNNSYIFLIGALFIEMFLSMILALFCDVYEPINNLYQFIQTVIGLVLKIIMSIY